jgi:hypothetical protein
MKVDFSQQIKGLDGVALKGEDGKELTLATVCTNAVLANFQDEANLSGEEKVKRYDLALAIYSSTEPLDLKSEDVALIKKLVAKMFGALVVGQAFRMLEGN